MTTAATVPVSTINTRQGESTSMKPEKTRLNNGITNEGEAGNTSASFEKALDESQAQATERSAPANQQSEEVANESRTTGKSLPPGKENTENTVMDYRIDENDNPASLLLMDSDIVEMDNDSETVFNDDFLLLNKGQDVESEDVSKATDSDQIFLAISPLSKDVSVSTNQPAIDEMGNDALLTGTDIKETGKKDDLKTQPGVTLSLHKTTVERPLAQITTVESATDMIADKVTGDNSGGDLDKLLNTSKMLIDASRQGELTGIKGAIDGHQPGSMQLQNTLSSIATSSTAATGTTLYQAVIHEAVGASDWHNSMSKQIVWMANQNIRSAEIKLTPSNLGTLEIRIDMDDDKVNLAIGSRHIMVRDAIEQTIPKLREMMQEQGLTLNNPDVSQQAFSQHRDNSFLDHTADNTFDNRIEHTGSLQDIAPTKKQTSVIKSAVDYYI